MNRKRAILTAAVAAIVLGGGIAAIGVANASVPPPVPAKTTLLPGGPRIVPGPGKTLAAGEQTTIQVAGKTFGGVAFPANITGLVITITAVNPASDGYLTVWTTDAGRPGTPTVSFKKGASATNISQISVNSEGSINVWASTNATFVMGALGYLAPDAATPAACAATIAEIPPSAKTLDKVGGSIRTNATDMGSITLPKGTYDTRIIGGWTGLNKVNNTVPADVFLTGTLTVVKGAEINPSFTNNVTTGGVIIPDSNSNTLTQDPTAIISTFLVLDAETEVHIKSFAYADNSGTAGSGELKANIQSAQFRKVC